LPIGPRVVFENAYYGPRPRRPVRQEAYYPVERPPFSYAVAERVFLHGGELLPMKVEETYNSVESTKFVQLVPGKVYRMAFDVVKPPLTRFQASNVLGKAFREMRAQGLRPIYWHFTNKRLTVQAVTRKAGFFPLAVIGVILLIAVAAAIFFGITLAIRQVAVGITAPFTEPKAAIATGITLGAIVLALAGAAFLLSKPSVARGAREAIRITREEVVPGVVGGARKAIEQFKALPTAEAKAPEGVG